MNASTPSEPAAERLARDNVRLYRQQRDIAVALQHALLPDVPDVEGATTW